MVITSIERRFGLQSTQSGLIASSYDLGSLVVMVPVSYLGGRAGASKPRWIAAGLVVMGLGSLAWTLPHWTTPPLEVGGGGAGSVPSTSSAPALCSPGAGGREGGEAEGDTQGAEDSMEAGTGSLQAYRSGGTSHVVMCCTVLYFTVYCRQVRVCVGAAAARVRRLSADHTRHHLPGRGHQLCLDKYLHI